MEGGEVPCYSLEDPCRKMWPARHGSVYFPFFLVGFSLKKIIYLLIVFFFATKSVRFWSNPILLCPVNKENICEPNISELWILGKYLAGQLCLVNGRMADWFFLLVSCNLTASGFLICRKSICYFRTKNDADSAISKINSGLVVGGRYAFILDAIYFVFSASMSYP